jgi:hypothetical protein
LVEVSVVVVVTGLRVVVSCEVLVVLCVADPLSLAQPTHVIRAAARRQGMISLFIIIIVVRIFSLRPLITRWAV